MLRLMLNQHTAVRIPSEAWFIGDLMDRLPLEGELSDKHLEEASRIILSHDRWKDWHCTDDVLHEALDMVRGGTLAELIDQIFRTCAHMESKPIWGEKSPRHSYYVRQIAKVFPNARFIHLVRDPRDVCTSMLNRNWYEGSVRRCAMCWNGMVESAMRAKEFGRKGYLQIAFEDLVSQQEGSLRTICTFLEIEYEPQMLGYSGAVDKEIQDWEQGIHAKLKSSPDTSEIGKWKTLKFWQILIIESMTGKHLKEAGYQLSCPWWLAWARPLCLFSCQIRQRLNELAAKLKGLSVASLTRRTSS